MNLRTYQEKFIRAMAMPGNPRKKGKLLRAVNVWHRRAGKDLTTLEFAAVAMRYRPGIYYYFLPTYTQAKKIVWDGIDATGRRFIDAFDKSLILAKHETELKITYRPNTELGHTVGSVFQLIGGDNIDTIVGTNPVGLVYSEFPLMDPEAWYLVEPILAENGGWAVFNFTPRGKNHGHKLWTSAVNDPAWYTSILTVDDTRRDATGEARFGEPVVPQSAIDNMRSRGMSEELIQQEFYCSFEGAMKGAYYADQIAYLQQQGFLTEVPYDPTYPVDTAWDLGQRASDLMAIWFTQTVGGRLRVIDYMDGHSKGLNWYAVELRRRGYAYGRHYAPFDINVPEMTTGNTRKEIAEQMGLHFESQPKLSIADGIQAARRLLPLCVFDVKKCAKGLDALKSYRREYDSKTQTWKDNPVHDWSSHPADAFRTRAVAWQGTLGSEDGALTADTQYDVMRSPEEQAEMGRQLNRRWSRSPSARSEAQRASTDEPVTVDHGGGWIER